MAVHLAAALGWLCEDLSLLGGGHSRVQWEYLELSLVAEMFRLSEEVPQPACVCMFSRNKERIHAQDLQDEEFLFKC